MEFVVTDPSGKEFIVNAPEGATQEQALEFAKSQFGGTEGGAALGNPNLARQGDKMMRPDGGFQPLADIGGAAAAGGALGAFSSEILSGLGKAARYTPQTARIAPFLESSGAILKAGGRTAPAIAGTISGAAGETAGQVAEAAGAGPVAAEGARIAGGGLTAETANLAKIGLKKYIMTPALSLTSKLKKETAIALLEKIEGAPQSITAKELKFLEEQIAELRGPAGKTDAPLERVGSIMGDEGKRLLDASDQQMIQAMRQAGSVGGAGGFPASSTPLAETGGRLQGTINKRNEAALAARSAQYTANEKARDAIVSQREAAGSFINTLPEYRAVVDEIKAQLKPGVRSPSVQAGFQKILSELEAPQTSFQALDDVRRQLGEAFRGKPAEGYEAIGETAARDLYGKVSGIQKKFAGGDAGPQAKLLDDYAADTKGLEMFSSKLGKKATALDQYREGQYANDPSSIPATYFKTRASVQALKELTGNAQQVNAAALEYADNQLAGKTGPEVRSWMGKNAEWLSETATVRHLVDKYATRLEGAERSMRNAQDFAAQAAKDSSMLTRNSLSAQRAVDLIKSGDTELWGKIAPVIAKSPQAKTQMVGAVRQVIADQATSKATSDLFSRNIRPFLEKSGIAAKADMEFIAQRLDNIQKMSLPEAGKLGMARRLLLQSAGGWTATAAARGSVEAYQGLREKMVPQ